MPVEKVDLELIDDNPWQPRSVYHKKDVDDLAASIKMHGLLQVPPGRHKDGRVQLGFGHLRKRAFLKLAKEDAPRWGKMSVDILEMTDEQMALFALEENIKRRDITPIEVARAVDRFLVDFPETTEDEMAKRLNMTQGNISNMRRVLRLPEQVLEKIDEGRINFTMGRELLVFQELANGKDLMLEAIRGLRTENTRYGGEPNTVEGLQKSIHSVARQHLKALEKGGTGWGGNDPLFDTRAAGCLQCQQMLRTRPTKSETAHWCINKECWEKKQQEHKDRAAAEARARMQEDVLRKVVAAEEKRQAAQGISQEILQVVVTPEQLAKVKASYSGDRIAEGQPVRRPFQLEGKNYICTGDDGHEYECYLLVPKEGYPGETRTYGVPVGREDEEYYESLRNDPRGFYDGMLVNRAGRPHVLVGPEVTFVASGASSQPVMTAEMAEALGDTAEAPHEEGVSAQTIRNLPANYPCHGCLNAGRCDRTTVRAAEGGDLTCDQRLTKDTAEALKKKATVEIPSELRALAEEKAGTRAQVLDINELRLGTYGLQLKQGYALLGFDLDKVADPQECLERCTQGFHYAFDSALDRGDVRYVCTNLKCLAKKKGAFTRAKNSEGQAKKKAEMVAIQKAFDKTTGIDRARMKLIMLAQLEGSHVSSYAYGGVSHKTWLGGKLGLSQVEQTDRNVTRTLIKALDKLTDEEMAKLIVEFMLAMLVYKGQVESYRIETTEPLNWMGIGVQVG